jgi:hypothetical protein
MAMLTEANIVTSRCLRRALERGPAGRTTGGGTLAHPHRGCQGDATMFATAGLKVAAVELGTVDTDTEVGGLPAEADGETVVVATAVGAIFGVDFVGVGMGVVPAVLVTVGAVGECVEDGRTVGVVVVTLMTAGGACGPGRTTTYTVSTSRKIAPIRIVDFRGLLTGTVMSRPRSVRSSSLPAD